MKIQRGRDVFLVDCEGIMTKKVQNPKKRRRIQRHFQKVGYGKKCCNFDTNYIELRIRNPDSGSRDKNLDKNSTEEQGAI